MSKRFDLEVTIDYDLSTPYNDLLWKGEWVRGFEVLVTTISVNKSEYVFPGSRIKVSIEEGGLSPGIRVTKIWEHKIEVPKLEPEEYNTSIKYWYFPEYEGVYRIVLEPEKPKRHEIWFSGSQQEAPVWNRYSYSFFAVRSQELEIIKLLKKLAEKGA